MPTVDRGQIWWADLSEPRGSGPSYRRPVLVIQSSSFNRSRIQTVIIAVITSNVGLAGAPGNVLLPADRTGLPLDSTINVSQLLTIDRQYLLDYVGTLPPVLQSAVDRGLRMVLGL